MTLWDMLKAAISPRPKRPPAPVAALNRRRPERGKSAKPIPGRRRNRPSMEARYEEVTRAMLKRHGVRVRRWRKHMSGIAWEVLYRDGTVKKLIESPRPRGPMSVAIFLHEIGHHAIGFNTYKPRCLEEYHAWRFAIEHMERLELNITDSVRRRMHNSLTYAVQKAQRRGIRKVPAELRPFMEPWEGKASGRRRR
jgi:hypothetical protein